MMLTSLISLVRSVWPDYLLARLFAWAGNEGKSFLGENSCESFYREKICHYAEHLHTQTARKFFAPLFQFSQEFWAEIEKARLKK